MNSSPTVSTTAEPLTSAIGIDMRYGIVVFSLFGLAIASTGCSRDAVDVDSSADAGRAIRFEGRCDDATRAVPGDPADGKVPVYWCDGDAVSVACAQATPSVGRYVLTCPDEFSVSASFGSGDSQQWGEGLHDFYAFSPADAPDLEISGDGIVKASLPSVQECRDGLLDPALLYLGFCRRGNLARVFGRDVAFPAGRDVARHLVRGVRGDRGAADCGAFDAGRRETGGDVRLRSRSRPSRQGRRWIECRGRADVGSPTEHRA